ncbi:MAG: preprotein translocase subunit YajC [Oscillospiraceae bacterium]
MEQFLQIAMQIIPFILIIAVFYFMLIRPQKKKDKEIQKMRNNLQVGDEITTIGGIVGLVVSIKEDTVLFETGGDRNKIRIKRWAIQSNNTVHEISEEGKAV